jgi:hypothetical protein
LALNTDAEVPGAEFVLDAGIGALRHSADFVQVVAIGDVDSGSTGPLGEDLEAVT